MKSRSVFYRSLRPQPGKHGVLLPLFTLALCTLLPAESAGPFIIVSAGDSVASGEGSPDVPREYGFNEDFNPVPFLPNPNFDPSPLAVNPGFDPSPGTLNTRFDPFPSRINPNFQPFPAPLELIRIAMEAVGIPALPPQNTTLIGPNPNYNPTLVFNNPNFDPNPVQTNAGFDPEPWSSARNPDFQPIPWTLRNEAIWESASDGRWKWAGPAQAARELIRSNPELNIKFEHRAKSGGTVGAVRDQVQAALDDNNGRIDILMLSAGGNNLHEGGFSGLIREVLDIIFEETRRPSTDRGLNDEIARNIEALEGEFDQLAAIIEAGEVGEVFITEYFNFTQDEEGFYTFVEADWIHQSIIIPLNEAITAAARKHNWNYVGGIADAFGGHGFQSFTAFELEAPYMVNPDFDPIESYPNPRYDPLPEMINLQYNPIPEMPNLQYNPIPEYPNLNYDPSEEMANPSFNPNFLDPNFDPRLTVPNPNYDPNLLITNPSYDTRLTLPNPDYDTRVTLPNPEDNPNLTIPNRDYSPDLIVPTPNYVPPWIVGIEYGQPLPPTQPNHHWVVHLEESLLIQGDVSGALHPNYWGQAVYRDHLIGAIERVMPTLQAAPRGCAGHCFGGTPGRHGEALLRSKCRGRPTLRGVLPPTEDLAARKCHSRDDRGGQGVCRCAQIGSAQKILPADLSISLTVFWTREAMPGVGLASPIAVARVGWTRD